MYKVLCAFALVFTASSVKAEKSLHPVAVRLGKWMEPILQEQVQHMIAKGGDDVVSSFRPHVEYLKKSTLHPDCVKLGLAKLEDVHDKAPVVYQNCSVIRTAVADVGQIVMAVVKFTSDTLVSLDEILNGALDCHFLWYNPISTIRCYGGYIWDSFKDMAGYPGRIKDLFNTIADLSRDIKVAIETCKEEPKKQVALMSKLAIQQTHLCSQRKMH